jgi:DNA-binding CsgD family transcriptional regulator
MLTPREREIMDLLSAGRSLKEIHATLGLKRGTVKVHIQNVKNKARVTGPVHRLIVWYLREAA